MKYVSLTLSSLLFDIIINIILRMIVLMVLDSNKHELFEYD